MDEDRPIIINGGTIILLQSVRDMRYKLTFDLLMENTIEINQFYIIAEHLDIWMPEFISN